MASWFLAVSMGTRLVDLLGWAGQALCLVATNATHWELWDKDAVVISGTIAAGSKWMCLKLAAKGASATVAITQANHCWKHV